MSMDERDRRGTAKGREGAARAPRSGGRTTEQRDHRDETRRTPVPGATAGGARGARHYPTQGTAALRLDPAEPVRGTEPATAPQLRVAAPTPISAPRAPFVALVIVLVLAGVFGILLINTKTNENSFVISRLQDQQSSLDNQEQQLDRQIAGYKNPGNLHANARRLGLVQSNVPAYIRLPDGKVLGLPGRVTGQPAITAQQTGTEKQAGTQKQAGTTADTGR